MKRILEQVKQLYALEGCTFTPVTGHEGGRNLIVTVSRNGEKQYVLRISGLGDRSENDYLAETEFVRFLAENGAPVADVIPSVQGRQVERLEANGKAIYVSLFAYAKGMLLADNGYRYREGASLSEYFFNAGKTLGAIHSLSRAYVPVHRRPDYFDKYNMEYLDRLIPENTVNSKQPLQNVWRLSVRSRWTKAVMAWFILISAMETITSTWIQVRSRYSTLTTA